MADQYIKFADSAAVDAFGRLRVSEPSTIFDSKMLNGKNDLVWGEVVSNVSGSASSIHSINLAQMDVGANAGDYVVRSTKMRFNYLPGKSHLILMTFIMGIDAGTTKRVGYFNCNNTAPYNLGFDGIWLEHDGTTAYWCIGREAGGVRRVPQSQWNGDQLGSTNSAKAMTVDFSAPLILFIDLEWLGIGRVRCGFIHRGAYVICHEFYNENDPSIPLPYMDSPNHSLRYEIRSDGGGGTLKGICGSVQSEGGYDLVGNLNSANRQITPFTTGNNTQAYPLLSIRLRADRKDGTVIVQQGSIICTTAARYLWTLRFNPVIAGVDNAAWTEVGGNSSVEYDTSRDNTNTVTGGEIIASGYGEDTNQGIGSLELGLTSAVRPGIDIDGTQDELVLCVQNLSSGIEDYYASINWREPL